MEEQGYITIKVSNKDNSLTPKDVDISEIKSLISNVETFLYPTRKEKKNRPQIAYKLQEGSAIHNFFLPISGVILFNGLTNEIKTRNNLDFLDYKRQTIIDRFQKIANKEGYKIELGNSLNPEANLAIDSSTSFEMKSPEYVESEFYIYGEIYQEGGKTPNLHITSKKYGNLTIAATKEQIMEGEKRTYKLYGVKVRGKKSYEDDQVFDLQLIEFLHHDPVFNKSLLDKVIGKASKNLSKITNVDSWIENLRAEGV